MSDLFNISARVGLDTSDFDAGMDHIELRLDKALKAMFDFASASVKSYSSYEQLSGGVMALYGGAAGTVLGNASTAYSRLGMSENDYLGNAIKYSAVLLKDLGGNAEEAARLVDLAMTDMMDNANRFGTSVSMLQTAYNGFARESYRTLGNLYLGYTGAKQGMEELIADAEAISGKTYDMEKFADVIEAIHVIQEEIGVTGTTQLEATTTIQGSVRAMTSAYSDFKTAFVSDNHDAVESLDNLISTAGTALENVTPRVESAMNNIAYIFETGALRIANAFASLSGATGITDDPRLARQLYDMFIDEAQRRGPSLSSSNFLSGNRFGPG